MNYKDFKHKINITVRFSDLDAMQHVNNANYLTYLEEARIAYFNSLFYRDKSNLDFEAVVGKIEIDYIYPIVLGDEVEVLTRVSKIGNKSVDVEHLIVICKDNNIIQAARSVTKLVYYDYKAHSTRAVPAEAKKIIAEFEALTI